MDRTEQLRRHTFLLGASDVALEHIDQNCRWFNAKRGQILLSHTEPSTDIYLLVSGSLEVEIFTEAGRSIFFRDVFPGELVGEIAAIDGKPRSASVVARTDCCVAIISAEVLWETLRRDELLNRRLLQMLADKVREMTDQVYFLTAYDVPTRIVAELLRMSARDEAGTAGRSIKPFPTHEAFATRVGTTREAVTRTLGQLSAEGFIVKDRSGITLLKYDEMQGLLPR
ncbi:MAG: Crp/Fnr family transcriptional regulator [Erythrobacter sp.]|nr:Crp/Fnr family transcriptional regulator [Erythrobacter sp.]